MLVYLKGTPTWQPENSVNIWNLHWVLLKMVAMTTSHSEPLEVLFLIAK